MATVGVCANGQNTRELRRLRNLFQITSCFEKVRQGVMYDLALRIGLIAMLAIQSLTVSPAHAEKLPTVGVVLGSNASSAKPYEQALRQGLRAQGYTDGKDIAILVRYANGDLTQFPRLLGELVAHQVDVLVVTPSAARAAMQATTSIPIISPTIDDPVERGLAKSFSRPAGNLTGFSAQGAETDAKRLELAQELVPGLKRLGLLFDPTDPNAVVDANSFRAVTEGVERGSCAPILCATSKRYGGHCGDRQRSSPGTHRVRTRH